MGTAVVKSNNGLVQEIDHGWDRIKFELGFIDHSYTKVGLIAGKARAEVIRYGTENEFGNEKVPSRPFIRQTIDTFHSEIEEAKRQALSLIYGGLATAKQTLFVIGSGVQARMMHTIVNGDFVPNAPSTIAKKGPGKPPLIDTFEMYNSIRHEEVMKTSGTVEIDARPMAGIV